MRKIAFISTLVGLVARLAFAAEPIRVFVTDSNSWSLHAGLPNYDSGGGARPQTAEVIKTFKQKCPQLVVTNSARRAEYVVTLDHEGGKHIVRRDNKIAVFRSDGDVIFSHSTRSLGNAIEGDCKAILADRPSSGAAQAMPDQTRPPGQGR